jgi:hypothetical protein
MEIKNSSHLKLKNEKNRKQMMRQGVTDANAMGFIHLNVHP